jgi:hypothetical protein
MRAVAIESDAYLFVTERQEAAKAIAFFNCVHYQWEN